MLACLRLPSLAALLGVLAVAACDAPGASTLVGWVAVDLDKIEALCMEFSPALLSLALPVGVVPALVRHIRDLEGVLRAMRNERNALLARIRATDSLLAANAQLARTGPC